MTTKHATYGFTMAFLALSLTALAGGGCSSDPNGSTGGTGGKGGSAGNTGGNGGSAASNLGPVVGTLLEGFDGDASKIKFQLSAYADPSNLASDPKTMYSWDPTEGSPSPGSIKITAPFSDFNQWVELQAVPIAMDQPLLNWAGKTLHVRVKVAAGLGQDPYAKSGAQPLVDTTRSYSQLNRFQEIQPNNQWQEFTLALPATASGGADPTMVITYGVQIASGSGGGSGIKPIPATVYVDSFSLE